MKPKSTLLPYLALIAQTLISAGTYLAGKRALAEIPAIPLVMLRSGGSAVCFILIGLAILRPRLPPRAMWWRVAVLGALGVPLNQAAFLGGLASSTPAHAALLYTLTPLFVFVWSVASGTERPVATKVIGLGIALSGASIVVFDRSATFRGGTLGGDALIFCAVLAWAGYTVVGKPLVRDAGPVAATVWSLTVGTLMFLPLGIPPTARLPFAALTPVAWAALAFLILLTSVVAYLCWYYALRELDPSRVAIFANLQPVVTSLASWLLFNEALTPRLIAGGMLVISGVVVTTHAGAWRGSRAAEVGTAS